MTGLIGWWPLHENSGSKAYDLSGNGNHGSLNGGVTQGVAGKGGLTSYSFDGSSGYVNIGTVNNLVSAGSNFTVSRWIKPNTTANVMEGVTDYDGSNPGNDNSISIGVDDGTWADEGVYLRAYRGEGSSSSQRHHLSTGETVNPDKWYHVTVSCDGSQIRLFVDGEEKASGAFEGMPNFQEDHDTENGAYFIGARNKGDGKSETYTPFTSSSMRIYNRALSLKEIQELYNWGNGDYARPLDDSSSSAISRWAFDGDATDSWNSNDGTTNGGLNFTDNAVRGQAANFDGTDDYIQTPLTSVPGKVSFSFWMKHSEGTSGSKVLSGVFDGNVSYQLQFNDGNYSWASYDGSSFHGIRNGPPVTLGEWTHVCAVYDGSDYIIYENGIEIDRTTDTFYGDNVSGVNIPIGAQSDSGNIKEYFDGIIDDFRIYSKALSPQEVFELYRYGTRGRDMRKFTVNSRGL